MKKIKITSRLAAELVFKSAEEMMSLTPEERKKEIKEMIEKDKRKTNKRKNK